MLFTAFVLSAILLVAPAPVVARERWLERDSKPVLMSRIFPRRFGQEQPAVLQKLRDACPGEVCGTLAGAAVTPLLAAQPECSQQDLADDIIDASKQFDADTQANMIAIAQEYRQAEKNTPPDFTTNPPTLRNSVFCQKAPRNQELDGLVQAQDPNNDPNVFFDPALGASVLLGSQANTAPFNGGGAAPAPPPPAEDDEEEEVEAPPVDEPAEDPAANCPPAATVTVTVTAAPAPTGAPAAPAPPAAPPASGDNLQTFGGALGGVEAPAVTNTGGDRPFQVENNATFNNLENALVRSCDIQNNQCANAANASGNQNGFDVAACNAQQQQCIRSARASA